MDTLLSCGSGTSCTVSRDTNILAGVHIATVGSLYVATIEHSQGKKNLNENVGGV